MTENLSQDWFAAMRRGDFALAWQVSDRILAARTPGERCWDLPRHQQWVWDGRPLANQRVLVRCYHGLGDTIQFARCLLPLADIAAETSVWAQPELIALLETLPRPVRLLPLNDATPDVDYDVDIEIMELPHALRLTPDQLARDVPYLHIQPRRARFSEQFSVGVAATTGGWDARRCIPAELFSPLAKLPGMAVFNLQLDSPIPNTTDLSTPDVRELAMRLQALDLVVTPDTMLAHLSGALAVPTWTLLPYDADWRWQEADRVDSPWYPTMRLWRQPSPGDWPAVLRSVALKLGTIAAGE